MQAAQRIRTDADKLELSPETSLKQAQLVKQPLERAVEALEQLEEGATAALTAIRSETDRRQPIHH